MSKYHVFFLFFTFLWAFTACQSQPTPTPAAVPVAQLPTATATFTAIPPTPTNTPDQVATTLAQPTRTPRPTATPTYTPSPTVTPKPAFSFPPFTETLQPFDTANLSAPLLNLVNQQDGSISQLAIEENWVYFNVGLRLIKMDINQPGQPTAVSDPLPLIPEQMEVANGRVYLLLPNHLLLAYEVGDSWQLMGQMMLPAGDKFLFTYHEQVYLEFGQDYELWQLSSALELQQKISYPAGRLYLQSLPQLYLINDLPVKLSQANLEQLPLTFTPIYTFTEPQYSDGYISIDVGGDVVAVYLYGPDKPPIALYQIEEGQVTKVGGNVGDFNPYISGASVNGNWLTTSSEGGDGGSCSGIVDIFNISNPASPKEMRSFVVGAAIYDLVITDEAFYASDGATLSQYFPLTNSTHVLWQSTGPVTQLTQTSEAVWAMNEACDRSQIFEYRPAPTALTRYGAVPGYSILLADSHTAYFFDDRTGLNTIQTIAGVLTAVDVDTSPFPSWGFYEIYLSGSYAVGKHRDGVFVYDTTNPAQWQLITELLNNDTLWYQHALWIDQMLYVSVHNTTTQQNELHLIDFTDITNPTTVKVLGNLDINLITAGNGFLYARTTSENEPNKFLVYDIQDPANPFLLTTFTLPSHSFLLDGTIAYVLGDNLRVYDLSNLAAPQLIAYYPTPGRASDLVIADTAVYLADGDAGILLFEKPTQE